MDKFETNFSLITIIFCKTN